MLPSHFGLAAQEPDLFCCSRCQPLTTVEAAKAFRQDVLRWLKLATNWKTIADPGRSSLPIEPLLGGRYNPPYRLPEIISWQNRSSDNLAVRSAATKRRYADWHPRSGRPFIDHGADAFGPRSHDPTRARRGAAPFAGTACDAGLVFGTHAGDDG